MQRDDIFNIAIRIETVKSTKGENCPPNKSNERLQNR